MLDRGADVVDWDLTVVDEAPGLVRHAPEKLLPEERALADKLIANLVARVQQLGFVRKVGAKVAVGKLIGKLQEAHLGEDSVGVIGERVWWRLIAVSELGDGIPPDGLDPNCSDQEVIIAGSVAHRAESAFFLIRDEWEKIVREAGPDVSSKVIRTVSREAWPKVKAKLGV
jgi:hypothetical protein